MFPFLWTVPKFTCLKNESYRSPVFPSPCRKTKWFLKLRPFRTDSHKNEYFIAVHLFLAETTSESGFVLAKYNIALRDKFKAHHFASHSSNPSGRIFTENKIGHGNICFAPRSFVVNNTFLSRYNRLEICGSITFLDENSIIPTITPKNEQTGRKYLQTLSHTSSCFDDQCKCLKCHCMKRVLVHVDVCENLDCPLCKHHEYFLQIHRTRCSDINCNIHGCIAREIEVLQANFSLIETIGSVSLKRR